MSGSTLTACALTNSVVTTTLYSSTTKVFTGARYQHITAIKTPNAGTIADTATYYLANALSTNGNNALYTKIASRSADSIAIIDGLAITVAQNFYFDFAQTNVF
jgi:hypothetical protein